MNHTMRIFAALVFCFVLLNMNAQTQGVAYPTVGKGVATTFVTDYHSLGINSSALGWSPTYQGKNYTLGATEFGFGMYSDSMNVDKLNKLFKATNNRITNKENSSWDRKDRAQAISDIAKSGVSIFVNYNWGGFSYYNEKLGGIAFNIRENYQWYSKLNAATTDLLFNGKLSSYFDSLTVVFGTDTSVIANSANLSQDTLNNVISGSMSVPLNASALTKGSTIKSVWNRYYNFGYGRKIFGKDSVFVLYGGVSGRFIQSMAMFDMESTDDGLFVYSSITPNFNIDYGQIALSNPSTYLQKGKLLPKSVGNGYGVDLSASLILFNKLRVALAVNNIGKVTYTRNVYHVQDTLVTKLSVNGISDYDVMESVNQLLEDGGILRLVGQQKYIAKNPTDIRFGASFDLGKIAKIGLDIVAPFNSENPGSIVNPVYSFGGEIRPVSWLALSAGYFGGGIYKNNIPVGLNFILKEGAYEFGVSSYDAISFFSNGSNSISAAFGFARIRF